MHYKNNIHISSNGVMISMHKHEYSTPSTVWNWYVDNKIVYVVFVPTYTLYYCPILTWIYHIQEKQVLFDIQLLCLDGKSRGMNVNKMLFLTIFGWFKVISITNGLVYRPESLIISEVSSPNFMDQQKHSFIELYAVLNDNLTLDAQDVMNLKGYHLIVFSKRPENLYPEFELIISFSQKVTKKPYIVIGHSLNSTIRSNVDVYFMTWRNV